MLFLDTGCGVAFLPAPLILYTPTRPGGEWGQRRNGLYIDVSGDGFSVYTYVNLYDVFILKFTYMRIYMKDLLKTPINHVSITAFHPPEKKCNGKTLTILTIPLITQASFG